MDARLRDAGSYSRAESDERSCSCGGASRGLTGTVSTGSIPAAGLAPRVVGVGGGSAERLGEKEAAAAARPRNHYTRGCAPAEREFASGRRLESSG